MQLVIADTGPINYLVLIGHIDLLSELFGKVVLPHEVFIELTSPKTPSTVRQWISRRPGWLEIQNSPSPAHNSALLNVDPGERAAIELALSLDADLLLIDDRRGVKAASRLGLRVVGTIGFLDLAAERGMVDFGEAVQKLLSTNFHSPEALINQLLNKHQSH